MTDADQALERLLGKLHFQIAQLSFGAPARQLAAFEGCDTCRIISSVLETTESLDHIERHRVLAQNSNDTAHARIASQLMAHPDAPFWTRLHDEVSAPSSRIVRHPEITMNVGI